MTFSLRFLLVLAAASAAAALALVPAAGASPALTPGLFDDAQTLFGDPAVTFPQLKRLRVRIVRITMYWGGRRAAVAKRRPRVATNPDDRAYDWSLYDRAVQYAAANGIQVLFSIWGTPAWANGGKKPAVAPRKADALRDFATAAALRYSGIWNGRDGRVLPAVRLWAAWNEPNNPIMLSPQYRRVKGKWVVQSALDYARICNAVYTGVHATAFAGEQVACGVTAPRGNNAPGSTRPSTSPVAFVRALAKVGKLSFDAWAHNPYNAAARVDEPSKAPPGAKRTVSTEVTLGNIGTLVAEVREAFGPHRFWITEYGYQTNPPDKNFGVPPRTQAAYLTRAYAIARANPDIDIMLWFLLRDEPALGGWQSGFYSAAGVAKPALAAFRRLPAPRVTRPRPTGCQRVDSRGFWAADFGHVASAAAAAELRDRVAAVGFGSAIAQSRGCGDFDVYVPGLDDDAVRREFVAEALSAGFQVTLEPPSGAQSRPDNLTAVFGSFPTIDAAQQQLTTIAQLGYRVAAIQAAAGRTWRVIVPNVPRSAALEFARQAQRAGLDLQLELG